ncbi:MAG: dehydrogenase [Burkholderiales bacterium 66-5]|nr:MAG: dehydrogenase [Burkholderiales bacterium 66-5]
MGWDAIVIGSGINGLAAAVHLSAKGWKVLVLEQAAEPGGAVQTAEVTLPGFRHDLCAMNLSMFAGSPFFATHKDRLLQAELGLVPVTHSFSSVLADGGWLGVDTDLASTAARIAARNAKDAETWRAMAQAFAADAPHLFAFMGSPMPSWQLARNLWRMWRAKGLLWCMQTARMLLSSPRDWLAAHFEDDGVRALMGAWGLHLDFGPDVAGGALFPYLESMANQNFGMALGQGGADTVTRALVRAIEQAGGEVRTSSAVSKIDVAQGRASGVTLADGSQRTARRAVIANVHPRLLYGSLLGAGAPPPAAAKLRPGPGTMMIHLALDALPPWRASSELQRFAYVHVAPSLDAMARTYTEAMAGLLPAEPVLVVGQPTVHDASRAPTGKHVLWVQVRVLPADIRGDAAGEIQGRHWDEIKDAYANRALALLERHAPGLNAHILARHVVSPLDLERDNPNLIGGDSLSGSHHLDQFFLFRPAFGQSRWRTPVGGLYNVGASTWPGAGTGAASGFMLARDLVGT